MFKAGPACMLPSLFLFLVMPLLLFFSCKGKITVFVVVLELCFSNIFKKCWWLKLHYQKAPLDIDFFAGRLTMEKGIN